MNGDLLQLMQAIGEMKSELQKDLGEVKSQNAAQLVSIISLRRELLGDGGRVKNIEVRLDNQDFWQNVKTFVVIPIIFAIHKMATVLGWKI